MTIKEVETRTGLARANIRYYEDQGFFTAARGENGYRDYSEGNIDTLLKLRLLRQLGFSLEDIHALQKGERSLEDALAERESGLERESQELDQAARMCRTIREDGADFNTLNATLYLDRLFQGEEIVREDRAPRRVFPWRRYFARILDRSVWAALLTLCFPLSMELNVLGKTGNGPGNVALEILTLLLTAISETVLIHRFGTTPGKALFGLKILREDGGLLSLGESARRAGTVAVILGLLTLPVLLPNPLSMVVSAAAGALCYGWMYWNVSHEFPLPWEREEHVYLDGSTKETTFWERNHSWTRIAGYVLAMLLCTGLSMAGRYWAAQPPYRGQALTAEQFVDNYNFYDMYERGETLPRLMKDGTFRMRSKREYGWHFPWKDVTLPELRFEERDGVITGVTIYREWESDGPLDRMESPIRLEVLPSSQVRLSMLALGVDRNEAEKAFQAVIEAAGNLHEDFGGVRVDCETRFSGYHLYFNKTIQENALSGIEGEEQRYFVEFSVSLT